MDPPAEPDEADCCNSGCNPCILDVYEEQLQKYNAGLARSDLSDKKNCLSTTTYTVFKLTKVTALTEDASLYEFTYERPYRGPQPNADDLCIHYKPGQHFLLRGDFGYDIEQFTKAFTPIPVEKPSALSFTALIKLYEGGLMSRFIRKLKINSDTLWRGPYGDFNINYNFKHMLCVGQGTGIAPIYSVIRDILNNGDCETFLHLYYCCRSISEVHLRSELYGLLTYWNFKYELFLTKGNESGVLYNETVNFNRLGAGIIEKHFSAKSYSSTQVVICGSEAFSDQMVQNLLGLNFPVENVHVF